MLVCRVDVTCDRRCVYYRYLFVDDVFNAECCTPVANEGATAVALEDEKPY